MIFNDAKRWLLGSVAVYLAVHACGAWAQTSNWPTRPVTLTVGFAPGGIADSLARNVAQSIGTKIGQSVIVDNKPGAGSTLAATAIAKSAPDGYSLLLVSSGHAGNAAYYHNLQYDTIKSFIGVGGIASTPVAILVNQASPYHSLRELIDSAKKRPGGLNFGTGGGATLTNLAAEMLKSQGGITALAIAYKGSAPALNAALTGEVDAVFDTVSSAIGLVQSGKLRALAVTSAKRSPVWPSVPTVSEQGMPGFDVDGWYGILAPAGTPPDIVRKLNAALNASLKTSETEAYLTKLGAVSLAETPGEFDRLVRNETTRWSALVRRLDLHAD